MQADDDVSSNDPFWAPSVHVRGRDASHMVLKCLFSNMSKPINIRKAKEMLAFCQKLLRKAYIKSSLDYVKGYPAKALRAQQI